MEYVVNAGVEQLSAAMTGSNEMEIKGSVGLMQSVLRRVRTSGHGV